MKTTTKKNLWYAVSRAISRGIPFLSVTWIYGMWQPTPEKQLTGMWILTVMLLSLLFYKDIRDHLVKRAEGYWKDAIQESKVFFWCLMFLLFLQWAKAGLGDLETLMWLIAGSQGLAIFPATQHRKYLKQCEKTQTQDQKEKATA